MPALLAAKPKSGIWTAAKWSEFGRRCQDVRYRIDAFREHALHGCCLTRRGVVGRMLAADVDAFIRLHDAWHRAMVAMENVMVDQHPELDPTCLDVIHGPYRRPPESQILMEFSAKILDREHWSALGRELAAIRPLMHALAVEANTAKRSPGTTSPRLRFERAIKAYEALRSRLDTAVCRQHPDWTAATRVFYGATAP